MVHAIDAYAQHVAPCVPAIVCVCVCALMWVHAAGGAGQVRVRVTCLQRATLELRPYLRWPASIHRVALLS